MTDLLLSFGYHLAFALHVVAFWELARLFVGFGSSKVSVHIDEEG